MRYFLWAAVVVGAVASLGVRFAHERMPSATFWQDHAGVLMTCIILTAVVPGLQARFVMHDLREAFSPFYEADRATWAALSSEVRFGLSFDEFQRTRDLYGVVAAVAILDPKTPGKYLGCVSLDTPRDSAEGIDRKRVEEDLGAVAVTIGLLIAGQS